MARPEPEPPPLQEMAPDWTTDAPRFDMRLAAQGVLVSNLSSTGCNAHDWATYNRENWRIAVDMNQRQLYQKENYDLAFAGVAREDVLEMMRTCVDRTNRWMLVIGLLVGVAMAATFGSRMGNFEDTPATAIAFHQYLLCMATGAFWLTASLMFSVRGQNLAMTWTMRLMTFQVRPKNPEKYNFNYMTQMEWWERQTPDLWWKIPGVITDFGLRGRHKKAANYWPQQQGSQYARQSSSMSDLGFHPVEPDSPNSTTSPAAYAARHHWTGSSRFARQSSSASDIQFHAVEPDSPSSTVSPAAYYAARRHWAGSPSPSRTAGSLGASSTSLGGSQVSLDDIHLDEEARGDVQGFEHIDNWSPYTWYMVKFAKFMRLWHPYELRTKHSIVFGVLCLGQGGAFFIICRFIRVLEGGAIIAGVMVYLYMLVLAVLADTIYLMKLKLRFGLMLLIGASPTLATASEYVTDPVIQQALGASGLACNFLLWSATLWFVETLELQDPTYLCGGDIDYWEAERKKRINPSFRRSSRRRRKEREASEKRIAQGGTDWDGDVWPTDDTELFTARVNRTVITTRTHIRNLVICTALLWLGYFGAAVQSIVLLQEEWAAFLAQGAKKATVQEILADWSSPLFRPELLACAGGQIYVTDRYRIFQVQLGSGELQLDPVQCHGLHEPISDLTAACDKKGCFPVAVVNGTWNQTGRSVVDCRNGQVMRLVEEYYNSTNKVTVVVPSTSSGSDLTDKLLLVSRGDSMVIHEWSPGGENWAPSQQSPLSFGRLVAISASEGRVIIFHNPLSQRMAIQMVNASTMQPLGEWTLPQDMLFSGGCSINVSSVIALGVPREKNSVGRFGFGGGGVLPRLYQVTLTSIATSSPMTLSP